MAQLLIIRPDEDARDVLVARRARLHERLTARLAPRRLDGQLARGIALFWHRAPEALSKVAARALDELEPRFNW
jgi:hypothetical protein